MPRNDLLSKDEQKRFDTPPQFTNAQKEYFFKLPAELEEMSSEAQKSSVYNVKKLRIET